MSKIDWAGRLQESLNKKYEQGVLDERSRCVAFITSQAEGLDDELAGFFYDLAAHLEGGTSVPSSIVTKECRKCGEEKSVEDFYGQARAKDGLDSYCKYCRNGYTLKQHRDTSKPPCTLEDCNTHQYAKGLCQKHYSRMWRNGTTERQNTSYLEGGFNYDYSMYSPEELRARHLSRYKMTLEEFDALAVDGCHLCGTMPTDTLLTVDHDHACCNESASCGKCVRGLLCHACNISVGRFESGTLREDAPKYELAKTWVELHKKGE